MRLKLNQNLTLDIFSINIHIGHLQYKKTANLLSSTDYRHFYGQKTTIITTSNGTFQSGGCLRINIFFTP
jgi:hypothetical protein